MACSRDASGCRIDRLFRIPGVQQRADFNLGQFAAGLEPAFNGGALLFGDRATLSQANQTVVIAAYVIQTVGIHRFFQEGVEECVNRRVVQVFLELQVQFKAQLPPLTT